MSRRSIEDTSTNVVAIVPNVRPEPPDELTREQAIEWRKIVNRMPVEMCGAEVHPLLTQLCRHIVLSRFIGKELDAIRSLKPANFDRFERLAKMYYIESRALTNLEGKLRLTPRSRYDAKKANTAYQKSPLPMPWEIRDDEDP